MQAIVSGIQTSYLDVGSGPVIVFVHGWLDSKETFQPIINGLSNNFRCIALDLPNFGKSETTEKIISVSDYATFIKDFLKKISVKDYIIVGHSMGGQITIYGIGESIIVPKKLILIASAGVRNKQQFIKGAARYATKPLKKLTPNKLKNRLYKKIGSDYQTNLSTTHKKIITSILSSDIQAQATKINLKTLLIYGQDDKHTPVKFGQIISQLIKNSKLFVINNQDHWVHKNAAKEVTAAIIKFINE